MKKILFSVFLVLSMIFASAVCMVSAEDEDTENDGKVELVTVSQDVFFDEGAGMYVYLIESMDDLEVTSNVCDGMYTDGTVRISNNVILHMEIFRDGVQADVDSENITEPGDYQINVSRNGVTKRLMSFTIVGEYSKMEYYKLPTGFHATGLFYNGEEVECDPYYVSFEKEGDYELVYVCTATETQYGFSTTIDYTPPEVFFDGVTDGIAKGAVTISSNEEGVNYVVMLNNEVIEAAETLDTTGHYRVVAYDRAGNSEEYSFDIVVHLNGESILFIILIILIAVGAVVYTYMAGHKVRVR